MRTNRLQYAAAPDSSLMYALRLLKMDTPAQTDSVMPATHERMVPESADRFTFWEHVFRYAFAARYVHGMRVLDIACGEGYGAAALKLAGAASVIGVDISDSACAHARLKYGVDARRGSAQEIPLPTGSIDLIVSYETIEHVQDPALFLRECNRVLAPGGQLIVSTPNKSNYGYDHNHTTNPFHCSEMTEEEFISVLAVKFENIAIFSQRTISSPWWSTHSLVIENSAWNRIPGFYRMRRAAQRRLAPEATEPPTPQERASVLELILALSQKRRHLLSPFALRPRSSSRAEQATYFIATAMRKK